MNHSTRKSCRICGSNKLETVFTMPPTPIGDNYIVNLHQPETCQELFPLGLLACSKCNLLQLSCVVDPDLIYRKYLYKSNGSIGLKEHFAKYASNLVAKLNLASNSVVYEIGCNDGLLLQQMKKAGMNVVGFEPAIQIASENNKRGLLTISDYFSSKIIDSVKKEIGEADLIIANNVLANIDDLDEIMSVMKSCLSPTGVIVIESGYFVDTIQNGVVDNIYHEHLSYLGIKCIGFLCQKHGLYLYDFEPVDTKGGSVRYYVSKKSSTLDRNDTKIQNQALEEDCLISGGLYANFATKIEKVRCEFIEYINLCQQKGLRVAGYGASVGVTTLLYYLRLSTTSLTCLYDDNSIKKSLYSPGLGIKVCSSLDIYKDSPQVVVIFCWRYANEIIKKHQRYLDLGGVFIVPFPEFKIIAKAREKIR